MPNPNEDQSVKHSEHGPAERVSVEKAVSVAQGEINRGVAWRIACWALLLSGSGALVVGTAYVLAGHRVPWLVYVAAIATAFVVFGIGFVLRRVNPHTAANCVDQQFNLADGVSAAQGFAESREQGGFYDLQRRWAEAALERVNFSALRQPPSRRLWVAALALPLLAGLLGFRPPSAAVLEAERDAALTLALGEELNQGIRDEVDRHLDEAGELEKEALDPETLRDLAEKLGVSEERADLMRQYAAMEQQIAEKSQALQQKRAEQLMDTAADRLADTPSTLALAEALRQKRYQDAAKLLRDMQPDDKADAETQRKQLKKLKAAAAQLGESARRFKSNANASGNSSGSGDMADAMAAMSEKLDQATQEYDKALAKAEQQLSKTNQLSEEMKEKLSQCQGNCSSASRDLQDKLKKLGARRSASKRLNDLRLKLSQCQGACAGQCASPFAKNGKGIGAGSTDSSNDQNTLDTGRLESVQGIKNAGPSETIVEEASSGTGTSGRSAPATNGEYRRQLESFVDRPDVPEALKDGVKNYFESLHQTSEETPNP